MLTSTDQDLRDLCRGQPSVIDAVTGDDTGLRLQRLVGAGGMSTVFLAELDASRQPPRRFPAATPRQLALKFLQPSTWRQFQRLNQDPAQVFLREVVALSRIMERTPPTEFVVGFYGSGYADIGTDGGVLRLPWLAIEYVDGGIDGVSLADRVTRAEPHGVDPIRALRLLRGIFAGAAALHEEGVVHRDIKPENVLVSGPVDDETPKLADCGIARVDGLLATVAGMTPSYGAPEQRLSTHGARNPLVGPWTDIHALAAVSWFILAGEDWCRSETDSAWHAGRRRSLLTAAKAHPGVLANPELLERLDAVLSRGAASRLPESAWESAAAADYLQNAKKVLPVMWAGPQRFADVAAFGDELFPLLEECAARWTARASRENRAATAYRPTRPIGVTDPAAAQEPLADVREVAAVHEALATPGCAVFQPDGRFSMRFGDRLEYFVDDEPHEVSIATEHRADVARSRWMARGPCGGFALIGPDHVLLVRGGQVAAMPPLQRPSGGEVGPITAVVESGRVFGVVTAETDDSNGGAELWKTSDGARWQEPVLLPLGGDVHCVAHGPYGLLVVGSRRNRARAMLVALDDHPLIFTKGVNDRPPLTVCACSAGRDAWAAGNGFVLYLERSGVHEETVEVAAPAVAMGLDVVGSPWLLTERHVLRRHVGSRTAKWRLYHRRDEGQPPFVAFGFTMSGVRVVDATGGGVHLSPRDVRTWRPTVTAVQ
jgi:serine/threonine protein kinase